MFQARRLVVNWGGGGGDIGPRSRDHSTILAQWGAYAPNADTQTTLL